MDLPDRTSVAIFFCTHKIGAIHGVVNPVIMLAADTVQDDRTNHDIQGGIRLELVGLSNPGNGRSGPRHPVCGQQVTIGSLIRFISVNIEGTLLQINCLTSQDISIYQSKEAWKKQLTVTCFLKEKSLAVWDFCLAATS